MEYPGKSKGHLAIAVAHGGQEAGTFVAPGPQPFQTGSEGYIIPGKFRGADGFDYQLTVSATRIHSKEEPEAPKRAEVAVLLAKQKAAARAAKAKGGRK